MNWRTLLPAPQGSHHEQDGQPAYTARFDQVLKFHEPGLAPVQRAGLAWHIHPDGRPAYPQRFLRTFGYYQRLATVQGEEGWWHIHPDGQPAYQSRHAWCGNFQEGFCTVRSANGCYWHILPDGSPLYAVQWRYAGDYRDGVCVVQHDNGHSTHLDGHGQPVHGHWFIDLDVFHKGLARAQDQDGWMHISRQGLPAYPRRFAAVEPFYNGQARVTRWDGGLEIIDEQGHTLLELRQAQRSEFACLSADMVGMWRTHTLAAAVSLGVIDALPGSVAQLSQRCQLHPARAQRLLRALGELSVVETHADLWQLTSRGQYLRSDHPHTLADAALEYAGPLSRLWHTLPAALQADSHWRPPEIFLQVAADPARCASHHRMLASYARHDYRPVPANLPLQGDERVIDAGGGMGVLSHLLLEHFPALQLIVLELPGVTDCARQTARQHPAITYRGADLFAPWPGCADAVLFARVLHDWDDVQARQLLDRAREALRPGGKLFIIEMLLPQAGMEGGMCDLHLLISTGGQERSEADYIQLMAQSGFQHQETRRLSTLPAILVGVAQ